MLAEVINK